MTQMLLWPDPRPLVERLGAEFFRRAPQCAGIYLMRDAQDTVLYVGKSRNLRQRLRSYRIANPDRLPRRHLRLLRLVVRIELRQCADELSALAAEAELLRSLRPRFNRAGTWPGALAGEQNRRIADRERGQLWFGTGFGLSQTVGPVPNPQADGLCPEKAAAMPAPGAAAASLQGPAPARLGFPALLTGLLALASVFGLGGSLRAAEGLVRNGGFEQGLEGWTRWGKNADLIAVEAGAAKSGTNCARIRSGQNALYFTCPLSAGQAYELGFAYRLGGANPGGQVALAFSKSHGPLRSAGGQSFRLEPAGSDPQHWHVFRRVFLPTAITATAQVIFTAGDSSILWLDDVSLRPVPRPPDLTEPAAPWDGLAHRTARPLFAQLLGRQPGGYTVTSWAHDLNPKDNKGAYKLARLADESTWQKEAMAIFKETGEAGLGFMDLPGRLDSAEPWRTAEFHREQFRKYGVRYDVFSEGSASIAAALRNGAELLNPEGKAQGRRPSVSFVDPAYVAAQGAILRKLGAQLRGEPFVGCYYGRDEPSIHIPEGAPEKWGAYGRRMAKEVLEQYGFGRFAVPQPREKSFLDDPCKAWRWIAYNRWMNDRFIATRCQLSRALHEANPQARYSPANYWFMSGFAPYDFSRLAGCSDLVECDPYASSAERERGRGVFNHGFGAKFTADLTDRPVRVVAQAFHYAGYQMSPEDLREWVSQALRCGASAITYYEMDSPRWTDPARWKMMLDLSRVITRMNRVALPSSADTAVLYTLYTHMSHGASTSGDQLYAAHALLGESAGSWFKFISDAQLERGERSLRGYKAVYLPLAKYMTPEASRLIENYVRAGGVLVCGDAEAFSFDLAGNDTSATRERLLGIRVRGPQTIRAGGESGKTLSPAEAPDRIILKSSLWGVRARTDLRLFDLKLEDSVCPGRARQIEPVDPRARIPGTYPDGSPAIVIHKLGGGRVITFAANPFAPRVTVDSSAWPALFKGLQRSLGCKVDLPIWRFALAAAEGSAVDEPAKPGKLGGIRSVAE